VREVRNGAFCTALTAEEKRLAALKAQERRHSAG
jgi:hypothetical protein